jgi:hypothetical protein
VTLNGPEEDSCVFTRLHPESGPSHSTLYDLDRRDEGFFTRLQFLLDAAEPLGVLVGLSLFDISAIDGPLVAEANVQGLALAPLGRQRAQAEGAVEALRRRLMTAVDWIATELRRRRLVWVEVFRGEEAALWRPDGSRTALGLLEAELSQRLSHRVRQPNEDPTASPWVAMSPRARRDDVEDSPLIVCQGHAPHLQAPAGVPVPPPEGAVLYHFISQGSRRGSLDRNTLWRTALRGCWPVVPGVLSDPETQSVWIEVAHLARFALRWCNRGHLRPAPEALTPMAGEFATNDPAAAATDGAGRYFIFFPRKLTRGVRLSVLPGSYRWYWLDSRTGVMCDHGGGVEGGLHCDVPAPGHLKVSVLILEQEEVPEYKAAEERRRTDPFS